MLQTEFEDTKTGNQNPYIEEEQTTQCPKEKVKYIVCFEDTDHQSGILKIFCNLSIKTCLICPISDRIISLKLKITGRENVQ
jgi:hypothetical protein